MLRRLSVTVAIVILVTGCATPGTAPVIEDAGQAPIEREGSDATRADTTATAPQTANATLALVSEARAASAAENHANAVAYLERAVRIEPRNARLWIELSAAHLANGNVTAAHQHARKAIALAGQDSALNRMAWLAFADVRDAQGSAAEASAIRRRYGSGEG